MRTITYEEIKNTVAELCIESCNHLGEDVLAALKTAVHREKSPVGIDILKQLVKNALIAAADEIPICQDCGLAVVFAEVGQEVHIEGSFTDAVHDGVIKGYGDGYLRKSTCTVLTRENYGNNAPAILHTKLVHGDHIKLTVAPKGGGAENMSALKMFPPAAGKEGIIDFVLSLIHI